MKYNIYLIKYLQLSLFRDFNHNLKKYPISINHLDNQYRAFSHPYELLLVEKFKITNMQ